MPFKGRTLTVGALLQAARDEMPQTLAPADIRHTAARNARAASALIARGGTADEAWRFSVLQSLDDYTSTLRRGGPQLAAGVFIDEPAPTGSIEIDAAFAALADFLAERDRWNLPAWASDPARAVAAWYPSVPPIFRQAADLETPRAFRKRGIFITANSLARA